MNGSSLFQHWSFESFVPGSILRSKYSAFRDICSTAGRALALLGQIEQVALSGVCADWAFIAGLTEELISTVRTLVDKLQVMNPVEFMDAQDWSKKIIFYTRLATASTPVSMLPPYVIADDATDQSFDGIIELTGTRRAMCIAPSLAQYVFELSDLRPQIDAVLRSIDTPDDELLTQASRKIAELLEGLRLTESLAREVEIAAGEIAAGGRRLHVRAYLGSGPDKITLCEEKALRAGELVQFWKNALTLRYTPEMLRIRLEQGLADEEVSLTVVAMAQGDGTYCEDAPANARTANLSARLTQLLPHVVDLHVFETSDSLRPEKCRSLYDLICLCFERGLKQIFSYAGDPGKGLAAIKQLRLDVPVVINAFNLGDAFFPSVAGKTVISVEDLRSVPAWSLLMGLGSHLLRWPGDRRDPGEGPVPHYSSYAVLSQLYMHCTLRLDCNLFTIECHFDPEQEKGFIRFWFKGGRGSQLERVNRLQTIRQILDAEGFLCSAVGDYLDAGRGGITEVVMQRSLVRIGLLIAWIQSAGTERFAGESMESSVKRFQSIVNEYRQQ